MRLYVLVVDYAAHTVSLREVKMFARSAQQLEKLFDVKPVNLQEADVPDEITPHLAQISP